MVINTLISQPALSDQKQRKKHINVSEGMSSSYGNSWADQWDHNPDPMPASSTYTKKKTGGGIGKTKEVAATGAKKVKQATSVGLRWIKDKYHKTTQKH
ncbi:hypothetical protein Hanom_Chr02g00130231 [Helianthus anomalus]